MKSFRYFFIPVLILALLMVRYFQDFLFYDPLLQYFEGDYALNAFPAMDLLRHFTSILFRYGLNTIISLAIIHLLFQEKSITRLSAVIFAVLFLILIPIYYYFIKTEFATFFTAGFYVRRLLIQPLMLLVLAPAIWYYRQKRS